MQAQSLLDRGAPAQAAEDDASPMRATARGRACCSARRSRSSPRPRSAPDSATLKANAAALQTWVAVHPEDSLAWSALGQTWGRLGVPLRSIRAEAEARYALGDLLGAVDRLRAGQRLARSGGPVDFIDASVLDSRLRAIEAQRRQILADAAASALTAVARRAAARAEPAGGRSVSPRRRASHRTAAPPAIPSHKAHARFAARAQAALRLAPRNRRRDEETHRGAGAPRPGGVGRRCRRRLDRRRDAAGRGRAGAPGDGEVLRSGRRFRRPAPRRSAGDRLPGQRSRGQRAVGQRPRLALRLSRAARSRHAAAPRRSAPTGSRQRRPAPRALPRPPPARRR